MIAASVMLMCARADADSSRIRTDRQHVADLDREVQGLAHIGRATEGTEHQRDRAVDRWLRDELAELRGDASDSSIVQARAIAAVARERNRADVAREADTAISAMVERRVIELAPRIAAGEWHAAIAQLAAWVPDRTAAGGAQAEKTRAQIDAAITSAERAATVSAERFMYARMHAWLGGALVLPDAGLRRLATPAIEYQRGAPDCPIATTLVHASSPDGVPAVVQVQLGSCGVAVRTGSETRTGTYTVPVTRTRTESYEVMETVQETVTGSRRECGQVTKDISGGSGPRNDITVSQCNDVPTSRVISSQRPITKYRDVQYTEQESREESYVATTRDAEASVAISVTVTGDGQTTTITEQGSARGHDEQFSRAHGDSRRFRSDLAGELQGELDASVQSAVGRAIDKWALQRARALLARAGATGDVHARRGLAVEAIVTSPAAVEAAQPFAGVPMPASDLVALLTGTPTVAAVTLSSGAGLELPKPSADLERRFADLEERHDVIGQSGGRDGGVAMGVSVSNSARLDHSTGLAVEVQQGIVPQFVATSPFRARAGLDVQLIASGDPEIDASVRGELGLHLAGIDVLAVGIAGAHGGYLGDQSNPDADHSFEGAGYAGYGAHGSIRVGKILLDGLGLRLHQSGDVSHATRLDGTLGYRVFTFAYVAARVRYVADADVKQALDAKAYRVAATLALVVQY